MVVTSNESHSIYGVMVIFGNNSLNDFQVSKSLYLSLLHI